LGYAPVAQPISAFIYVYGCYDERRGADLTMAREPITIAIDPDSELGRVLDETTDGEPVVLLRGRTRFRVIREADDPWASYDPESVLEGLQEIAGTLSPEEGERIKELIYRGREEGTRPITRP
jgi:hypothetical protein